MLLGAPLGVMAKRGGFAVSTSLSFGFFLLYYILLITGEELADSELLNNYLEMRYAGFRTGGILRGVDGDPVGLNSDNKLFLSLGSVGIDSLSTYGDPRSNLSFYYNGDESLSLIHI